MYRYSEDTSTSSEDDTSTAGVKTADMCRSVVRKGMKVLRCTGCGYTSDRRANVTRHYRRIHCQLKKRRKCTLCVEIFETKWKFYQHCNKYHPTMRQSWYTTTYKYKLKQTIASKRKFESKSKNRVERRKEPVRENVVTRLSTRLRSRLLSTSTSNDSSTASFSNIEEVTSMDTTEEFSSSAEVPNVVSFSTTCSDENSVPCEAPCILHQDIAHLPIKKRILSGRKFLGDITNKVRVQKLQELSDKQRAYINHIDFDELDAMLQLHHIKAI